MQQIFFLGTQLDVWLQHLSFIKFTVYQGKFYWLKKFIKTNQ